ncbi:MAG: hypothetical protein FWB92_10205, partial [Oscillospiraceae bacterium]|nr:hypothetical protein [Oscillospiraceae bacterium]
MPRTRQTSDRAVHSKNTVNNSATGKAAPPRNMQGNYSKGLGIRQKNITQKGANTAIKGRKPVIKPVKTAGKASGKVVKTARHTAQASQKAAVATVKAARVAAHA